MHNKTKWSIPSQKSMKKKEKLQCGGRTEWIGIASCFVKPHPSSSKMEKTFHSLYALCFVRACDGWRAWRHTPAVLIRHHIITKGLADWDDLLHPLACCCHTPSFSKDNSVTPTLPLQNKPTLMKDCRVSIKNIQIQFYWHPTECCSLSYIGMSITLWCLKWCSMTLTSI